MSNANTGQARAFRPPKQTGPASKCAGCGETVGKYRAYYLSKYTFCTPCHRQLFVERSEIRLRFRGIMG